MFTIDNVDLCFSFPFFLGGGDGTYSTDFELPMSPEVVRAFGVGGMLTQSAGGKTLDGTLIMSNGRTFPCKVRAKSVDVENNSVSVWMTVSTLPEIYSKRVCDIAEEYGSDLIFDYFIGNSTPPLPTFSIDYDTGRDYNASKLPSIRIIDFLDYLDTTVTGGMLGIDTSTLENNITLTPTALRISPLVKTVSAFWGLRNPGDPIEKKHTSSAYFDGWKFEQSGITYSIKLTAKTDMSVTLNSRRSSLDTLNIYRAGVLLASYTNSPADRTINFLVYESEEITVQLIMTNSTNPWMLFDIVIGYSADNDAVVSGDMYDVNATYYIHPTEPYLTTRVWCQAGFYGCFTQTLLEVCQDIAAQQGRVLAMGDDGNVHFFDRYTMRTLNLYKITGYEYGNGALAKNCWAAFCNKDANGNVFKVLLNRYETDELADDKDVVTLKAAWAESVDVSGQAYAHYQQFDANDTNKFLQGESYFFARAAIVSPIRLVITGLRGSGLPEIDDIVTVALRTPEDTTMINYWHIEGRDWLITERTTDAEGTTELKAVLMR